MHAERHLRSLPQTRTRGRWLARAGRRAPAGGRPQTPCPPLHAALQRCRLRACPCREAPQHGQKKSQVAHMVRHTSVSRSSTPRPAHKAGRACVMTAARRQWNVLRQNIPPADRVARELLHAAARPHRQPGAQRLQDDDGKQGKQADGRHTRHAQWDKQHAWRRRQRQAAHTNTPSAPRAPRRRRQEGCQRQPGEPAIQPARGHTHRLLLPPTTHTRTHSPRA
jgi:hypothetical protein